MGHSSVLWLASMAGNALRHNSLCLGSCALVNPKPLQGLEAQLLRGLQTRPLFLEQHPAIAAAATSLSLSMAHTPALSPSSSLLPSSSSSPSSSPSSPPCPCGNPQCSSSQACQCMRPHPTLANAPLLNITLSNVTQANSTQRQQQSPTPYASPSMHSTPLPSSATSSLVNTSLTAAPSVITSTVKQHPLGALPTSTVASSLLSTSFRSPSGLSLASSASGASDAVLGVLGRGGGSTWGMVGGVRGREGSMLCFPGGVQQRAGMAFLRRKLKAVRNIRTRHRYDQIWSTKRLSRKQQKMYRKNRNVYVADLGRGISLRSKLEVLKQFFTDGSKKIPYPVMRNALYEPDLHLESVGEAARYLRIRRSRIMYARKLQNARKLALLLGNLNRQTMLQMYKRSLGLGQADRRWAFITAVESRLDMNVLRMGFAENILAAQQMVRHNRFMLNGGPINLRGQMVKPGDVIAARGDSSDWLSNYLGHRLNLFFNEMYQPFTRPSVLYDVPTVEQESRALVEQEREDAKKKDREQARISAMEARRAKERAVATAAAEAALEPNGL